MEDELKSTTPNSPTDHLQIKVALLDALVKSLRDTIKEQFKHIEELRMMNHRQTKEIEQLKSEIRRLKNLKNKPKLRASKMNKDEEMSFIK
jgi:predicted RNase H-like nuclease (RuvC/YqgF family)